MNQENDICDERKNAQLTQFDVLRNAIYHSHCRRIMEFRSRLLALLVVVLGASSVGEIIPKTSICGSSLGPGLVYRYSLPSTWSLTSGEDLEIISFSRRATTCYSPRWKLKQAQVASDFARWRSQMITITSSEPPVLRAIDAKAHNETVSILGMPKTDGLIIPWHHWFLGRYVEFFWLFIQEYRRITGNSITKSLQPELSV